MPAAEWAGAALAGLEQVAAGPRRLDADDERDVCRRSGKGGKLVYTFKVTSQAELEELAGLECTRIGRDYTEHLIIDGNVTSLAPLAHLKTVSGQLKIARTGLRDLEGLSGLQEVFQLFVSNNPVLRSLEGLSANITHRLQVEQNPSLVSMAGPRGSQEMSIVWIHSNPKLRSIGGLDSLQALRNKLVVERCRALTDLKGLRHLRTVDQKIRIARNTRLQSMEGLSNLHSVWGEVWVTQNPSLLSLWGLHGLRNVGHFKLGTNARLRVFGGVFSDARSAHSIGTCTLVNPPLCVAPQEWTSIASGIVEGQPEQVPAPPTWQDWLRNGCGPGPQNCMAGTRCLLNLTESDFRGTVALASWGRPCGPCHAHKPTANITEDGMADVTELLRGEQPGAHPLCRCGSGPLGTGPVTQISLLGPRSDHAIACALGAECTFGVRGLRLAANASVALEVACGGARAGTGRWRWSRTAVQRGHGELSSGGQEDDDHGVFSFGGREALLGVPPGIYRLCWRPSCGFGDPACVDQDIGSLSILGPWGSDSGPAVIGRSLSVANLGLGVGSADVMRVLPRCGTSDSSSPVSMSGVRRLFSFSLNSPGTQPGFYRKCWCGAAYSSCTASSDFMVDAGGVEIVCRAGEAKLHTGGCVACPAGTRKTEAGNEPCETDPVYVILLTIYSALLFLALSGVSATLRRPIRVEDVFPVAGGVVVTTLGTHGLHMYRQKALAVRFYDTGNPALDSPEEQLFARRASPTSLELLGGDGNPPTLSIDSSRGFILLPLGEELRSRGWPAPLAVSVPAVLLAAVLLHVGQGQSLEHAGIGLAAAAMAALLFGAASRLRLRRKRTQLERRIEDFREVLSTKNPRPVPCEKGPGRAIDVGALADLLEYFRSFIRDRDAYFMDSNILGPLTSPHKLSYAELVGPKKVEFFVSHYWGNSFVHFFEAVQKHAEHYRPDAWPSVAYWICFCSNNQYSLGDELGTSWSESSFFLTLRSGLCRGVCMVLDDAAMPLTRSWCIFELLQTLRLERSGGDFYGLLLCTSGGVLNYGQGSVEVAMSLAQKIATLDLERAGASCESDKAMINAQVIEELGSFAAMNRLVREKMHATLVKSRALANESFESLFRLLDCTASMTTDAAVSREAAAGPSQAVAAMPLMDEVLISPPETFLRESL